MALGVGALGLQTMALVDADFSRQTLLLVAAGITSNTRKLPHITRLLPVYNSIVEKMQRPAVAARLQQELVQLQEGLPHSLLTYSQMLALFIYLASEDATILEHLGHTEGHPSVALMAADIDKADRQVLTRTGTVAGVCGALDLK